MAKYIKCVEIKYIVRYERRNGDYKRMSIYNKLSKMNKFLLYVNNMRAIIRRDSLFSDCTEQFLEPCEPKPGDKVKIRFRTFHNNPDMVYLCAYDIKMEMHIVETGDMFDIYETEISVMEDKVEYYFEIVSGFERCYYTKLGVVDDLPHEYFFTIVPGYETPEWAKGAVMYQIFVDRFYNGDRTNDVENGEYSYIGGYTEKVENWDKYPAAMGVREFYGGDLQGVLDKMDYLQSLGIEAIYFNPLFVSPSNHKYDIQDYDYIDPHYGRIVDDEGELLKNGELRNSQATKYINRVTNKKNLEASNELFVHLVEEAHRRGIKVIIDGVFNHCGSFNKWMDKEHIYEDNDEYKTGAYETKDSPYHNFFNFFENDDNRWPENSSYDGWWGYDTLPKLNYQGSKELEEYVLGIAKKWVSPPYNVDGWRLDVAADLGYDGEYNHQFWRKFRNAVKEANPNAIILAEHYGDPSSWLQGDQWDTVMNYDAFMEPITWYLTGMEKHSDSKSENLIGDTSWFINTMKYNMAKFHTPSLMVAMNELSNHDHSRFLTRTNGIVGRTAILGPEAANQGVSKAVMKEAVVMQMTWIGAPTVYYGDEAGVCGWTDPDNRRTYPWGHEDMELVDFHREMIRIRKENIALKKGSYLPLVGEYNFFVYGRFYKNNRLLILINNGNEAVTKRIRVFNIGVRSGATMEKLMETGEIGYSTYCEQYPVDNYYINITVKGKSAVVMREIVHE